MGRPFWKRSRFILSLLGVYILLQFLWWAYLLAEGNPDRLGMVIGEGSVFLLLLLFGLYRLKKAFDREMELAEKERNFMMAVTHELRSPLTSIKLFLQTLQRKGDGDAEQKQLTEQALSETDRLNGLIDNILLTSRIEGVDFTLDPKPLDLAERVREALDPFSRSLGKDHKTEFQLEEGQQAELDPQAFSSILSNLYENAVKYSPKGSTVRVEAFREGNETVLRVSDEGKGIPVSEKERVLEKFYRSGQEEVRESKGTGLGLYIVQRLVALHQGELKLEDAPSGGTVAEVRLPTG